MGDKVDEYERNYNSRQVYNSARPAGYDDDDVFGHEEGHDIQYKTLTWPMVAVLMIAEIVSNGKRAISDTTSVTQANKDRKACYRSHHLSQWLESCPASS
jgi:hypothetical protein